MVTYQHPGSNSSPQAVGEAEQLVPQPPQPTPNANVKEILIQFRHHWLQYSQHRFSLLFFHCVFFLLPSKVSVVLTDAETGSRWAVGYDKHQLQPLLMTPSSEKRWGGISIYLEEFRRLTSALFSRPGWSGRSECLQRVGRRWGTWVYMKEELNLKGSSEDEYEKRDRSLGGGKGWSFLPTLPSLIWSEGAGDLVVRPLSSPSASPLLSALPHFSNLSSCVGPPPSCFASLLCHNAYGVTVGCYQLFAVFPHPRKSQK